MSLYDGLGLDSKEKVQRDPKPELMGWSSGIKLLQSQLQLKKAALTQAKREQLKKGTTVLPPVVDLKSRRDENEEPAPQMLGYGQKEPKGNTTLLGGEWDIRQEYEPLWPNDYEKIMRDRAEREKRIRERERERDRDRERERDRERDNRDRDREREYDRDYIEEKQGRRNDSFRYNRRDNRYDRGGGGGGREFERGGRELDRPPREEEYEEERPRRVPNAGAAIAPPPSLMEPAERKEPAPPPVIPFATGSSIAARIMAKYGFKEGQGLGKKEQGMSQALQVEKTSKRTGKIIHEKDIPKIEEQPPSPPYFQLPPPPPQPAPSSPTSSSQVDSITEIMKSPSKVVLLRNMVGPGEVDEDLEPETKEECGKYGDVIKCVIFEIPDLPEEESVRIFIEFKRLESAIKAVVDLNGRYFGGRVVKAGFYDVDKFKRLELAP